MNPSGTLFSIFNTTLLPLVDRGANQPSFLQLLVNFHRYFIPERQARFAPDQHQGKKDSGCRALHSAGNKADLLVVQKDRISTPRYGFVDHLDSTKGSPHSTLFLSN